MGYVVEGVSSMVVCAYTCGTFPRLHVGRREGLGDKDYMFGVKFEKINTIKGYLAPFKHYRLHILDRALLSLFLAQSLHLVSRSNIILVSMDPSESDAAQLAATQLSGENDVAGFDDGENGSRKRRTSSKVLKFLFLN
nr:splicing factor U2af large subunit A-like isoform X1 [Ipomoea batatas]